MDLAPRVAAKVGTGLSAHAVDVDIDKDGGMIAHVPSFGGSVMASIACAKHRPQMSTIPAGFLQKPERQAGRKAVIEKVTVEAPKEPTHQGGRSVPRRAEEPGRSTRRK